MGSDSTPVYNHIGYTISGVQLFGPLNANAADAVAFEAWSFDDCGGHVTDIDGQNEFIDFFFPFTGVNDGLSADYPTGGYHCMSKLLLFSRNYLNVFLRISVRPIADHQMPGDEHPKGHNDGLNLNYTLCEGVRNWYNESTDSHSPLIGFMLDGYAIYGPKGEDGDLPVGLDMCGGHSYDLGYYHYHVQVRFCSVNK